MKPLDLMGQAIVVDTETTGLWEPEIVEVAWVEVVSPRSPRTGTTFHQRYRPSKPIELGALATHHILDEELLECPPSSALELPVGIEYLIGHRVDFDWKVLGKPLIKRIDTLMMAWRLWWPELDSLTLGAVLYGLDRAHARERLQGAHSALRDVNNCLFVLWAVCEALPDVRSWEDLWRFSEDARIPLRWPFGKHRGKLIEEAPIDYREWCLRQADMDEYVIRAVERTMHGSGVASR